MNKRLKKFIIPFALTMALTSTFLTKANTTVVHADNPTYQSTIQVNQDMASMKSMSYDELMNGAIQLPDDLTEMPGGNYRYATSPQVIPSDGNVYYVQTGNITMFYKYIGVDPYSDGVVEHVIYSMRFKDKTLDGYGGSSYNEQNRTLYNQLISQVVIKPITPSGKSYSVKRLYGATRFDTCRAIANDFNSGTVDNVIVASGLNYPDALSGSVLANRKKAPILLVGNDLNDSETTIDYIQNHLSKTGTIYVLGGESSVGSLFINKFQLMGFNNIKRLSGADRYQTCNAVNDELNFKGSKNSVFLVSGNGFADGLSVGAIAGQMDVPVFMSDTNNISDETLQQIKDINPSMIYIVGGKGVISDDVQSQLQSSLGSSCQIRRYAGNDRYETSQMLWTNFKGVFTGSTACLASGENFPDALAGSALAEKYNAPVILVNSDINSNIMRNNKKAIDATNWNTEIVFGGQGSVDDNTSNFFKQ